MPSHLETAEETIVQSGIEVETKALLSYLNAQRDHVLGTLEGLDEETLRNPILPSGWSCLGMVQHLALDVERFWFQAVVAGDQSVIAGLADTADPWQVGSDVPVQTVFDVYRQEIELANAIIVSTPVDAAPAWWPHDLFGDWKVDSLREIILHVMTETACHSGHLDTARELVDGKLWLVLTG
jgi:hypothetical protein